jgi:hypothetical protein
MLMAVILSGVAAFGAPPSPAQVAQSILFDSDGRPIRLVVDAALQSRFTVGSSLDSLAEFFHKLGGFCAKRDDGVTFRCEAAIEPCENTIIAKVHAEGGIIEQIEYLQMALAACN